MTPAAPNTTTTDKTIIINGLVHILGLRAAVVVAVTTFRQHCACCYFLQSCVCSQRKLAINIQLIYKIMHVWKTVGALVCSFVYMHNGSGTG